MKLVFDMIKSGEDIPQKRNYHFNKEGGVIGRSSDSSWQLVDKHNYISNQHVYIEYLDEVYFIRDESSNGTYLKFPYKKLPKGNRIKINSTDIYILGEHEIQARFVEDDFSTEVLDTSTESNESNIIPDNDFLEDDGFDNLEKNEIDVMDIVSNKKEKTYENTISYLEKDSDETENNINMEHINIPKFSKEVPVKNTPTEESSLLRSLNILEEKLGIEISSLEKDDRDKIFTELGDIILNTLDGLRHSLHLKEKIKENLNVLKIEDKPVEINPILLGKSASHLLKNNETGGLLGISKISNSITQSFNELDHHNIALHGSSKNIIKISTAKFSPKNLEYHFEVSGLLRSNIIPKRLMMWTAYKQMFDRFENEPEFGVDLISKDFSREYNNLAYSLKLSSNRNIK